jgi:hypothetical protein
MKSWLTRLTLLMALASIHAALFAVSSAGELIVFTSQADHPVSQDLVQKYLPQIEAMAKAQDIAVKVITVTDAAPELVTFTPAIVFQNHLGRSLYVGRYHYIDKIKTFIRTVKRLPQQTVDNEKHDVLVARLGRSALVTPVKLTDLAGSLPAKFNQAAFHKEALNALAAGMKQYKFHSLYHPQRTERLIYTAFYPYRGEDGKLFVSAEMYSQFNCVDPIYKRFDQPFEGTWQQRKQLFMTIGAAIEAEVMQQLSRTDKGDGLVPLPATVKTVSWESLGLPLPPAPPASEAGVASAPARLSQQWSFAGPVEQDIPVVGFAFPAPIDYYAGELSDLQGNLSLGDGFDMASALGVFSVRMESLTMGDVALDHSVQGMLKMVDHPVSHFIFQKMKTIENAKLAFGYVTQFVVLGEFEFMGVKAPAEVTAQVEPVLDEAGAPRLQVFASFTIRLQERYGVKGPDGPADAKDTVNFTLNFLLQPAA